MDGMLLGMRNRGAHGAWNCRYGCCDTDRLYNRSNRVSRRRSLKRSERQTWQAEVRKDLTTDSDIQVDYFDRGYYGGVEFMTESGYPAHPGRRFSA